MLARIKSIFTPPVFESEEKTLVARILNVILLTILAAAIVFPLAQLISGLDRTDLGQTLRLSAFLTTVVVASLWLMHRRYLAIPSVIVPLMMLGMFSFLVYDDGLRNTAVIGYLMVVIAAGLLLGKRGIAIFALLCLAVLGGLFYAEINQLTGVAPEMRANFEDLIALITNLGITTVLFYVAISNLSRSLERTRRQEQALVESNRELQAVQASLEERVAIRTQGLEAVTTISEHLSAILDLEQLLAELVNEVKERFGYYHAHIYLFDQTRENLVVAEGTGPAGAEMKAQRHTIPLNAPTSLVARTARSGQIVSVENVREAEDWLPNPLLPDTYSEMAVPIILSEQIVGVLDVQEDAVGGLDEADAGLLRSLANQVAIAIRNANLFAEVETALAETRAAQQQYLEQAWSKAKIVQPGQQYLAAGPTTPAPDEAAWRLFAQSKEQALSQTKPALVSPEEGRQNPQSILAPIRFRDITIGALQMHLSQGDRAWQEDDLAIIEAVLEQMSQMAETLRLFENARARASRERTIRQITEKMRAATRLEGLVKTAAEQLGEHLSAGHAVVELGME